MPTGYTHQLLENDLSFEQFAMLCARNFGALAMMRDEPMDAPIPERLEPSEYAAKHLDESRQRLAYLQAMSEPERIAYGTEEIAKSIASRLETKAEYEVENAKLNAMLDKIKAWSPPSADHICLRDFMASQCKISMHTIEYVDSNIESMRSEHPKQRWQADRDKAEKDVAYYTKETQHELDRTASSNKWLRELRESLAALESPRKASSEEVK